MIVRLYSAAWPGAVSFDTSAPTAPPGGESGVTRAVVNALNLRASVDLGFGEVPTVKPEFPWIFAAGVVAGLAMLFAISRGVLK